MNYGAEPADQVVRYTLEGTEFALKISGTAAKNFAVFALAVLRDQKKTHGKTKLVRLLREGKPLKFFSVPTDQMRDFAKAAKSHGLLYVPIRDRSDPDNIEIAVWAEDAAKVNRVIDKLQLDVVDTGEAELVADVQKGQSQPVPEKETIETEHGAVSFAVGESEEQFNMDFTQPRSNRIWKQQLWGERIRPSLPRPTKGLCPIRPPRAPTKSGLTVSAPACAGSLVTFAFSCVSATMPAHSSPGCRLRSSVWSEPDKGCSFKYFPFVFKSGIATRQRL